MAKQQQRNTHFNIFFKTGQLNIKFDGTLSLVREELEPLIPEETPTLETAAAAAEERFTESKIAKWSRRRSNPKKLNKRRRGRGREIEREKEREEEGEREGEKERDREKSILLIINKKLAKNKQNQKLRKEISRIEHDKVNEKVKRENIISQVKQIGM